MDSTTLFKVIAGTWFIIQTNFLMWLKGDKNQATLSHIKQLMQADTLLVSFVNSLKDLPKEPK